MDFAHFAPDTASEVLDRVQLCGVWCGAATSYRRSFDYLGSLGASGLDLAPPWGFHNGMNAVTQSETSDRANFACQVLAALCGEA